MSDKQNTPDPRQGATQTRAETLSPEARAWADGMLLSLEAGNAEPTPEQWESLRAEEIDHSDFVTAYGRAGERIDAHHAVLTARLCEFTSAEDIDRMAARGAMAVVLAQLTAARLDLANARAERDRAEMATVDAIASPCSEAGAVPYTPPRYDAVFAAGTAALDADEGTGGEDVEQPCEPAVLADTLSLVLYSCPSAETIATWTVSERLDVEAWAAREHLSASDSPCERLPMPAALARAVRSMEAGS